MRQMQNVIRIIGAAMCIALLSGCASVKMQETPLVATAKTNYALVTFVRPSIFAGDGISVDIWDGEHFIGALGAGTLVQYEVEPGEHLFLANSENWSYASANLLPGKRYFIKANIFPGVMYGRVALGVPEKSDNRIDGWLSKLTPMTAGATDKQGVELKKQTEVKTAVSDFKSGKVSRFAQIHPEDGL
jgi:hypothetical protein